MLKVKKIKSLADLSDQISTLDDELFDTINVEIYISPLSPSHGIEDSIDRPVASESNKKTKNHHKYFVSDIKVLSDEHNSVSSSVSSICEETLKSIRFTESKLHEWSYSNWSIFYLYKELIQQIRKIVNSDDIFFRGQASNWPTIPSSFREKVSDNYLNKFDDIYHYLSFQYKNIDYYPIEFNSDRQGNKTSKNEDNRAENIALLQHFGLPTPFIDLTSNEFISMFFMVEDQKGFDQPTLDIFFDSTNSGTTVKKIKHSRDKAWTLCKEHL
ncbi:FRG domain-containing protein [Oenococcus oeni]